MGSKILESDAVQKAGDVAENVGGKILDTGKVVTEKAGNVAENVGSKILESDAVQKAGDVAENVGGKILDTGGDAVDAFKGASENVGEKILDTGGDLANKAAGAAAVIGGGILAAGSGLVDKAKEVLENPEQSIDSAVEKAKGLAEDVIDKVKNGGELSDKVGYDDLDKSTLEGTDDFFSRADRFAKGDYHNEGANKAEDTSNDIFQNTKDKLEEESDEDS